MKGEICRVASSVLILLLSHCSAFAQWARTSCPLAAECIAYNGEYLFVGSDGGVARSADDNTWVAINNGLSGIQPIESIHALFVTDSVVFAATQYGEGVFKTTTNGDSWARVGRPVGGPDLVSSFVFLNNTLFAAATNDSMYRSTDEGTTWSSTSNGIFNMGFAASIGSVGSNLFAADQFGIIYRSTDMGSFWSSLFEDTTNSEIATFGNNTSTLFIGSYGKILRSIDQGDHWDKVLVDNDVRAIVTNGNMVFVGGLYGIRFSADNGLNWKDASKGLPDSCDVASLYIKDGFLYAGVYYVISEGSPTSNGSGLWKRPLSDFASVTSVVSKNPCNVRIVNNPSVNGNIRVESTLDRDEHIDFQLRSVIGTLVFDKQLLTPSGVQGIELSIPDIANGIYFLEAKGEDFSEALKVLSIR